MIILSPLLSSGSKAMNVNGSVTPQTFSYAPSVPTRLQAFNICLIDEGSNTATKFGALTALTNGVLLQATIGGVTTTIATIKDNGDLCTFCYKQTFGSPAVLSLLGIATPQGFLSTNVAYIGRIMVQGMKDVILQSGDTIQAVVQDNLAAIDFLRITAELEID